MYFVLVETSADDQKNVSRVIVYVAFIQNLGKFPQYIKKRTESFYEAPTFVDTPLPLPIWVVPATSFPSKLSVFLEIFFKKYDVGRDCCPRTLAFFLPHFRTLTLTKGTIFAGTNFLRRRFSRMTVKNEPLHPWWLA